MSLLGFSSRCEPSDLLHFAVLVRFGSQSGLRAARHESVQHAHPVGGSPGCSPLGLSCSAFPGCGLWPTLSALFIEGLERKGSFPSCFYFLFVVVCLLLVFVFWVFVALVLVLLSRFS